MRRGALITAVATASSSLGLTNQPCLTAGPLDAFNGENARNFLHELEQTQALFSEATELTGHLEAHAGARQVALDAADAEVEALHSRLSEADAMVASKIPF